MKNVTAKRKVRWDNIFWLCYELIKWTIIIGFLGWMVFSYAEVMMHRYEAGYDYGFNFFYVIMDIVDFLKNR